MSVRQGNNIIAGGVVVDNVPTSGSSNAVSSGGVYTALNGKVDTGHQVIAFQEPTALNNYIWYRLYDDGWVEQGGLSTAITGDWVFITLPISMQDSNYIILGNSYTNNLVYTVAFKSKTQTGFQFCTCNHDGSSYGQPIMWQVSGMAAN